VTEFPRLGFGTYKLEDRDDEDVAAIDALDSTHRIVEFEEAPWNRA